jgi:hypothetical protein
MRKSLLAAAALAAVFLLGAPADKAAAMMSATPGELGLATPGSGLVQKAALVCGRFGCRRVWAGRRVVWGARRVWWGPRRVAWRARPIWWGARRVAWRTNPIWWRPRPVAWGPRPLFAYAGPSPGWGWSSPGFAVSSWSSPGWGWSSGPSFSAGWGGVGWGGAGWGGLGWGRGWNDW